MYVCVILSSFGFYVDFPFFSVFQAWKYIHLPLSATVEKKLNNSELSDRCQLIFKTVLHLARKAIESRSGESKSFTIGQEHFPFLHLIFVLQVQM